MQQILSRVISTDNKHQIVMKYIRANDGRSNIEVMLHQPRGYAIKVHECLPRFCLIYVQDFAMPILDSITSTFAKVSANSAPRKQEDVIYDNRMDVTVTMTNPG